MWKKKYSVSLLVGVQAGATTMKVKMASSQTTDNQSMYDPTIPVLEIQFDEVKSAFENVTCNPILIDNKEVMETAQVPIKIDMDKKGGDFIPWNTSGPFKKNEILPLATKWSQLDCYIQ